MNSGKIIENYVKPIIHKSYYNFKYGKNHKRGACITWGLEAPWEGTGFMLPYLSCWDPLCSPRGPLFLPALPPPIAHSCLWPLPQDGPPEPAFLRIIHPQRLVKPNLLCKASNTLLPIALVFGHVHCLFHSIKVILVCDVCECPCSFCNWKKGAGSSFRVGTVS